MVNGKSAFRELIDRELQNNIFPPLWWESHKEAEIERIYNALRPFWHPKDVESSEACQAFVFGVLRQYLNIKPLYLSRPYERPKWSNKSKQKTNIKKAVTALEGSRAVIRFLCNGAGNIIKFSVDDIDLTAIRPHDVEFLPGNDKIRVFEPETRCYRQVCEYALNYLRMQQAVMEFYNNDGAREKLRVFELRRDPRVFACSAFYEWLRDSNLMKSSGRDCKDFISEVLGDEDIMLKDRKRKLIKKISNRLSRRK